MRLANAPDTRSLDSTLSEFLNLLDLRGQSWCIIQIRGSGGFTVPPTDGVVFYAALQGTARVAGVGGEIYELPPGEARMILSGEAHTVRTRPNSPAQSIEFMRSEQNVDTPPTFTVGEGGPVEARILCGRLKTNWPSGLSRVAIPPVVSGPSRIGGASTTPMRVETLELLSKGGGAAAVLTRIASLLLSMALRSHPQFPLLFRLCASRDPVAHALELIGANPAADWSVAQLARKVGMGRSNFAARFAIQVGKTPLDVITERRMQLAARLLEESDMKISEISARAGYSSEAAFSRRFTRFFGISPGRMRRSSSEISPGDVKRSEPRPKRVAPMRRTMPLGPMNVTTH